jgi:ABC-2 type transport system ATP-binding protein
MIVVEHLSKRYGRTSALDGVSFRIGRGAVVGLLGPNGAGKTTTLRILGGILGATTGRVSIAGHDLVSEPMRARNEVAYLPETPPLYPELRVDEYLSFRASLRGLGGGERAREVGRVVERTGLGEVRRAAIGTLSRGFCQRVGIASTLLGSPPVLLLDEPTSGLDPNQIREIRSLVGELRESHTILLSTHVLGEVEALCSSAIVLSRGRVVADAALSELAARQPSRLLAVRIRGSETAAIAVLTELGLCLESTQREPDEHLSILARAPLPIDEDALVERLIPALLEQGLRVLAVAWRSGSLDEAFAQLTKEAAPQPPSGGSS